MPLPPFSLKMEGRDRERQGQSSVETSKGRGGEGSQPSALPPTRMVDNKLGKKTVQRRKLSLEF